MTNLYGGDFFSAISAGSSQSAPRILPVVVDIVKPKSVVDVGCGTGEWLRVLATIHECDIVGLDGDYVPLDQLAIPVDSFISADLSQPLVLERNFDLAMSMEVAEHLPPSRAPGFVHDLTNLAPAVLFSAAVPGQGGVGHINEQWQHYWIDLFRDQGFHAWDIVRPSVWDRDDVAFWYKQNMFLFVDPNHYTERPDLAPAISDLVHPALLDQALTQQATPTLRRTMHDVLPALKRSFAYHYGRVRSKTK